MKLMIRIALSMALLSACAPVPAPIVDMSGKDPVQVQRDQAACVSETQDVLSWGNPRVKCMRSKGYVVLSEY